MSDKKRKDQFEWFGCCQGHDHHMPWCPAYKPFKEVTTHGPATSDIGSLLDRLREEWSAVIKERDELELRLSSLQEKVKTKLAWHRDGIGPDVPVLQERYDNLIKERDELRAERTRLREVVQELLNRFYPHLCNRGPNCDKCRALLRGAAVLRDQKEPSA